MELVPFKARVTPSGTMAIVMCGSEDERKKKALAIKKEVEDNRSVGQVARDVHLTNINAKLRSRLI